MRKKNIASQALLRVRTVKRGWKLKELIEAAEMELSKTAFPEKNVEENRTIEKMKLTLNISTHTCIRKPEKMGHLLTKRVE